MRAVVIEAHGGLDQIKLRTDWPEPTAGPGQAVVDVRACGLNYLDIFVRRGMPGLAVEMPRIPGGDISGVVSAVGAGIDRGWIGRRVMVDPHIKHGGALGEHANGGLCDRIAVDGDNLIAMPDSVTFEQAAALPIAYGTAWRMMITRGQVKKGETVLILGASGGVGTACVQIARNLGAIVIACASSKDKLQRLKELGADHLVDYTQEDFSRRAWEISGKKGVDVVINYTGGDTWVPSIRALALHGRLLTCGATAIIDRLYPLEQTAEAMRVIEEREVFGKVILRP
jgi:alcohol dehydrogenase